MSPRHGSHTVEARLNFDPSKKHQFMAMDALAKGLHRHGIAITNELDGAAGDFVVTWGLRDGNSSRPRLILEAGYLNGDSGNYINDRLRFVSVGWNGVHGRADSLPFCAPADRWRRIGKHLMPWRPSGQPTVLVCSQHPNDDASPPDDVWSDICGQAKSFYPAVKIRPHPLVSQSGPIAHDLENADLMITWNSTSAVEAVIAGIPTITFDRGSIAWPVSSHALNEPAYTGLREPWCYDLAYRQYTLQEFSDGTAWEYIRLGLEL